MSFVKFLISKSFFKNAFLIIVVSGLLLFSLILFLNLNTKHGDFVVVPDLIGKTINQVSKVIDYFNRNPLFAKLKGSLYLLTKPYKHKIDQMLKNLNLSTFDALWLSYVEGMAIGGIIMLIIS